MSIGAVLDLLRPEFPDVTISKIRFLEAEGLVTPQRSASGYRRFTAYDCARLRYVLTAQRDHYLPLKVIKAHLDAQPDGELPEAAGFAFAAPRLVTVADQHDDSAAAAVAPTQVRLSREDLLERSGVDDALLAALIKAGVDHAGPRGSFRRARRGDPAMRQGVGRFRRRAAASARVPVRGRPAVRSDRPDRRTRWARAARRAPGTAPTTWPAKLPRWRSRCTRR